MTSMEGVDLSSPDQADGEMKVLSPTKGVNSRRSWRWMSMTARRGHVPGRIRARRILRLIEIRGRKGCYLGGRGWISTEKQGPSGLSDVTWVYADSKHVFSEAPELKNAGTIAWRDCRCLVMNVGLAGYALAKGLIRGLSR